MKLFFSVIVFLLGFVAPMFLIPRDESSAEQDCSAERGYLEEVEYKAPPQKYVDVAQLLAEREAAEKESDELAAKPELENERKIIESNAEFGEPMITAAETKYPAPYSLSDEERDLVERVVMHEAGYCPDYRLLILTAQCFRNDCELNGWRPYETYSRCGYAAMNRANDRSKQAVSDVFDKGLKCVDEQIFCFYNRNLVYSADHERHNLAIDIGGNRFFY